MRIIKSTKTKTETLYESFDGNIFDTEHKCKLYEARNIYETYVQKIEFLDITYDTFKCNDVDDWYYIIYYLRFNLGSGFNVYEKDFLKYAGEQLIVEYDSGEDWDICRLRCANDFVKDLEETLNQTKTSIDKIKFLAQLPPLVSSKEW